MAIATEGCIVAHRRGYVFDQRTALNVQDNIDRGVSRDEVSAQSREDLLLRSRHIEIIVELGISTILHSDRALGAIECASALSGLRIDEFTYLSIELERYVDTGAIIDCLRIDFSRLGFVLGTRAEKEETTEQRSNSE